MKPSPSSPPDVTSRRLFTISAPAPEMRRALQIKTILVPVDFSRESLRVLEYSLFVARKFSAAIHVVHVRPTKEVSNIERAGNLLLNYTDAVDFLQDRLKDIEHKHSVKFLPDHCHVETGRPFEEICKIAHEINADLIVMGTRGQSGLKRLLLGSTSERVIRFAPCPVLIPRGQKLRAALAVDKKFELKVQKILAPADFSNCSLAGVEYAVFLGKRFDARVKLLHIVAPYSEVFDPNGFGGETGCLTEAARKRAEEQMDQLRHANLLNAVSCEAEIASGDIVGEICGQSAARDVDLLVISTHGRSGFQHALLGSVAEHIARYVECPVLIVPNRDAKE